MTTIYINVASASALSADIKAIDLASQASGGNGTNYLISMAAGLTLSETADIAAIDLKSSDSLTIDGENDTLNGAGAHRGLFVYAGTVTIEDLIIKDTVAKGGAGADGGGGGAGLGGGLFVADDSAHGAAPSVVTLDSVLFEGDLALGGAGAAGAGGGGGGLGGAGGNGAPDNSGGGGGIDGVGGGGGSPARPGLVAGVAGSGGGGGPGDGGGIGAGAGSRGEGGFGGGGGGAQDGGGGSSTGGGGGGGFGGGGGGGQTGGNGGFGGGGGAGGPGGYAGFGAGAGAAGGGGGGLGAGGDIFVQAGATLNIINAASLAGGGASGGDGAAGGDNGEGFASGIFLQGYENINFFPSAGTTQTITDVIADQSAGSLLFIGGAGHLTLDGFGTLALDADNEFVGGVAIVSGTLLLGADQAAGSGAISFTGSSGTLALASGVSPTNTIDGFAQGDAIDLTAVAPSAFYGVVWFDSATGGSLEIAAAVDDVTTYVAILNFSGSFSGETFGVSSDGGAGVDLELTAEPWAILSPDDILYSDIRDEAYSALKEVFNNGVLQDQQYIYTGVVNQPFSSYAYDYAGENYIGSEFYYTNVTGEPYTGYETDYDGGGHVRRIIYTGVTGSNYSAYEYNYNGGVYSGSVFDVTAPPAGSAFSSYEVFYNYANVYEGDRFFYTNLTGAYTGEQESLGSTGKLTELLLTGFSGPGYSSLEEDFNAGVYTGYRAFYTNITHAPYTNEQVQVSAANVVTQVEYSGTFDDYSSVVENFSNGALTSEVYDFTSVTGASYYAYQVQENAAGVAEQETLDENNGSHRIVGLGAAVQTFYSVGADIFTGGGGAETFVLTPIYGADVITDFYQYTSGLTHDTISLASAEFQDFGAVTAAATNVGNNVIIKASDGDSLTLDHLNVTTLQSLGGDFAFRT